MMIASGYSSLTLRAAVSASSALMTMRSVFSFSLSPTVNCIGASDLHRVRQAPWVAIVGTLAAEKDFWLKPQNIRLSLSSGIARRHSYAAASDVRRAQQRLQQGERTRQWQRPN